MTSHREDYLRAQRLEGLLACPACGGDLQRLRCGRCGKSWPEQQGRPVLLPDGRVLPRLETAALEAHAAAREARAPSGLRGFAQRLRERTTAESFADDRCQVRLLVDRLVGKLRAEPVLVDLGAGEQYYRAELERLGGRVVTVDCSLYGPTDVVGDAHALPLRTGSVDALFVVEVLEHLERPWDFFREAGRVLRPGGYLVGVTPQYCPTHGFPYDFFRYTEGGLRSLAKHAGLEAEALWPLGGRWATALRWVWANQAREHSLRRVPGLSLAFHAGFQALVWASDRLDEREGRGTRALQREHNDHLGWSFVLRKPA